MKPLEPPDMHRLNAAQGWLMLGNPAEGWNEFHRISAEFAHHPEVLGVKWSLLSAEKRWLNAVAVAEQHLHVAPDDPTGWIHRSFALHEVRRTREAFALLLPACEKFPREAIIPYNLACYSCQLDDLAAARTWFDRALALDESVAARRERLKSALEDADLKPLWPELKKRLASQ